MGRSNLLFDMNPSQDRFSRGDRGAKNRRIKHQESEEEGLPQVGCLQSLFVLSYKFIVQYKPPHISGEICKVLYFYGMSRKT